MLDATHVDQTIKSPHNQRRLERCYADALRRGVVPREVRMIVGFVVGPDGSVESARVERSTIEDQPFDSCIVGVFGSMVFAKPSDGSVTINYPLMFKGPA